MTSRSEGNRLNHYTTPLAVENLQFNFWYYNVLIPGPQVFHWGATPTINFRKKKEIDARNLFLVCGCCGLLGCRQTEKIRGILCLYYIFKFTRLNLLQYSPFKLFVGCSVFLRLKAIPSDVALQLIRRSFHLCDLAP